MTSEPLQPVPGDHPGFPEAFNRTFPRVEEAESAFFAEVLPTGPDPLRVLDLGCGAGRLGGMVRQSRPGVRYVGVDRDMGMLRLAGSISPDGLLCADFRHLPFATGMFDIAVSGLLSLNYAASESEFLVALREASRVVRPTGILCAEIAVAWRPARLAGLAESHDDFTFMYHDVISQTPEGAVLRAEMRIGDAASHFLLFVPAVASLGGLLERTGWELDSLYAPHDLATRTLHPPQDCLRAVVLARRAADQGGTGVTPV